MGASVTFDYQVWIHRYPEFKSVAECDAQGYFDEATLYHRNDGGGPVADAGQQRVLLNMLTAHIAKLYATVGGVAPSGLVGRITDASEGSVSAAVDKFANMPNSAQWYIQTPYGFAYWQATRQYRTAHYRPGIRYIPPGAPYGRGGGL